MKDDKVFLMHAMKIAEKGIDTGHGPFGAVIAKNGRISR